mmetsp:Transcript_24293/g.46658  ORF Transcript_24293/g.46658 Transcript_24293/m.46658 type:complete len:261 (-) Transcript_24293:235-1017(-)
MHRQLLECKTLPGQGCGYVRFSSWEAATEAIQQLNERAVSGWAAPLQVRFLEANEVPGLTTSKPLPTVGAPVLTPISPITPIAPVAPISVSQVSPQPAAATDTKLLQAMQQITRSSSADGLNSALQALLGGDVGAAVASLTGAQGIAQASRAWELAAAAAGGLGVVGLQDEAVVAAQGLDPKRLFVGQLSRELTDKAALTRLFEPFGQIESLRWLEDKGVAYVQYSDFPAANSAQKALNGKRMPGISREQGLNVNFSRMR